MERASFRWHGTTCTVKTPWNTHPTAVSPLKPSHSPLSIWVCFPRLHSSFSRLSPSSNKGKAARTIGSPLHKSTILARHRKVEFHGHGT